MNWFTWQRWFVLLTTHSRGAGYSCALWQPDVHLFRGLHAGESPAQGERVLPGRLDEDNNRNQCQKSAREIVQLQSVFDVERDY